MVPGMERPEARADVGEPDPARQAVLAAASGSRVFPSALPHASVLDHEHEPVGFDQPRLYPHHEWRAGGAGGAMLHRILHERIEKERRHFAAQRRGVHINSHVETLLEAHLLDRQVAAHRLHLFLEQCHMQRALHHCVAKVAGERGHHLAGALAVLVYQRAAATARSACSRCSRSAVLYCSAWRARLHPSSGRLLSSVPSSIQSGGKKRDEGAPTMTEWMMLAPKCR